ncbi:adenylyl-sulfate kinase [Cerasicoccus arenae]|uniref:Adenylyl-sulfate kinase n=1 Tax=Cerasicoccus arenae TaxID=424488 RepID=A0A8J3DAU2_9BACT|nr:adenylyl-sulfate kinase [Cerasicoccus arenae]MBK1858109.1 adenylyl-sulfate kinase [Cerasicoccus arenae]GHB96527.1 adenylyl-sulfate kinase [Cerasicoccus arenae]
MAETPDNIYHVFDRMLPRADREAALKQRSHVFWLFGLSGSGKSTLALALERELFKAGRFAQVLDGDNIRSGLNRDLGFSDADRSENIRRIAEVAKLFAQAGVVTITSFICPKEELRALARETIGADDFSDIYVKASYERCQERDPKGLYKKVQAGQVKQFTGKDSGFEEPTAPALIIDTENETIEQSVQRLLDYVLPRVEA